VGVQIFFVTATKLTTAANAIFLQYTAPIYIALMAYWFLGEKPQRADWMAMPTLFLGMMLFFGDRLDFSGYAGNLLAILSGVAMAVVMVCMRGQKDGSPGQIVLLGNILSFFVGLPSMIGEAWTLPNLGIIILKISSRLNLYRTQKDTFLLDKASSRIPHRVLSWKVMN